VEKTHEPQIFRGSTISGAGVVLGEVILRTFGKGGVSLREVALNSPRRASKKKKDIGVSNGGGSISSQKGEKMSREGGERGASILEKKKVT